MQAVKTRVGFDGFFFLTDAQAQPKPFMVSAVV
jgi:hypothetical protein